MNRFLSIILAAVLLQACTSVRIYVSPDGDDSASGSRSRPLASASAAVARALSYSPERGKGAIEIIFCDGEYPISGTITIAGNQLPLTLRSEHRGKAVFTGERNTGIWEKVSDPYALERLQDASKVLQTDLKAAGIPSLGTAIGDTDRFDFYYKGRRQTLAMWPNEGFAYAGEALGETEIETFQHIHACKEPVISYVDDRIGGWVEEKFPCAHGYWQFNWYDRYNPIEIDPVNKIITVSGDPGPYGFRDGCRFRGVNLLSELDMEGEYWLDRDSALLFWYAPEDFGGDNSQTCVSVFSGSEVMVLDGCTDVSIDGLAIRGCRGGAIRINGGERVRVENCSFKRFACNVITVEGGRGHKIYRCSMDELGRAGIFMRGGDRNTLEPAGFEVSHCSIESLSLYIKTYQPCIYFDGIGLEISHNLFRDCPSSALRLDGNDVSVRYNIFENLVCESDDQGGIDIFNNYSYRGIVIAHNYFHNIGKPEDRIVAAVRFDDRISGMRVEGNIFNHCGSSSFGAVQINGGQDNVIRGNVFYDCTFAISQNCRTWEKWLSDSEMDRALMGITPGMDSLTQCGRLYLSRYPEMAHMLDRGMLNVNYASHNLIVRTPEILREEGGVRLKGNIFIL